jgi:hypothetical protein
MPYTCGLCGSSGGFALGVMLAMDRRPLLGHHAGGQPQPATEEMRHQRMQIERAMRLMAVQEDGHRGNGDVRQTQRCQHVGPPGPIDDSSVHEPSLKEQALRF